MGSVTGCGFKNRLEKLPFGVLPTASLGNVTIGRTQAAHIRQMVYALGLKPDGAVPTPTVRRWGM